MNQTLGTFGKDNISFNDFLKYWGKDKDCLQYYIHDDKKLIEGLLNNPFALGWKNALDVLTIAMYALQMQEDFSSIQSDMKSGNWPAPDDIRFTKWIGYDGYKAPEQQYEEFGNYRRMVRKQLLGLE